MDHLPFCPHRFDRAYEDCNWCLASDAGPTRNPEMERAAQVILSFWETEDIQPHLDAGHDMHMDGDAGNASDIIEAFLKSAAAQ